MNRLKLYNFSKKLHNSLNIDGNINNLTTCKTRILVVNSLEQHNIRL